MNGWGGVGGIGGRAQHSREHSSGDEKGDFKLHMCECVCVCVCLAEPCGSQGTQQEEGGWCVCARACFCRKSQNAKIGENRL